MPMSWNNETDAKLFMAVLKVHKIKLDWDALAVIMGPECTGKAISHRIAKLKTLSTISCPNTPKTPTSFKREHSEVDTDGNPSSSSQTPSKRPKKTPVSKKANTPPSSTPSSFASPRRPSSPSNMQNANPTLIMNNFPLLQPDTAHILPSPCPSNGQSDYDASISMSSTRHPSTSHYSFPSPLYMPDNIAPADLNQLSQYLQTESNYSEDAPSDNIYGNDFNLHAASMCTNYSFYEDADDDHP